MLPTTPNDVKLLTMNMHEYLKKMPRKERAEFAARCGTTLGHLTNVAYGYRPCGPALAMAIEEESGRELRVESIAPECRWHVIRGNTAP